MNMTLIAAAISAALAGSIGFGAAWTLQGRDIDALRIEAKDAIIIQQRAARQAIERATNNVREAQTSAAVRNADIRRDAGIANDVAGGLRVASTSAVRTATDDGDACRSIVRAYDQLFSEGGELLREVSAVADQCISDNKALSDAWAKN